jgi:hypothetical protein
VSIFGDGATIKSVPLINVLAAGPNNLFALLGASKSIFGAGATIKSVPLINVLATGPPNNPRPPTNPFASLC